MKKRGSGNFLLFVVIFSIFLFSISFLSAEENVTNPADKGYSCLEGKVIGKCGELNTEQKIFSLLALGECKNELIIDALDGGKCWPKESCNVKTTAQAILALNQVGVDTTSAEEWLLSKNTTSQDLEWYLQVEVPVGAAICNVTYLENSYVLNIGDDRKLSGNLGSGLSIVRDNWWILINSDIYNKDITVSCDKGFFTTLHFRKDGGAVHVSEVVNQDAAGGETKEKVSSYCFGTGGICDYEGSLWATYIMDKLDYDMDDFLPYVITMEEDNKEYFPEVFLSMLAKGNFKAKIFSAQRAKHWKVSDDEYYDTALALLPFQSVEIPEKTKAQEWLLEKQGKDGCWAGVRNTAFILYSIWPRNVAYVGVDSGDDDDDNDCGDAGFFCMQGVDCEGKILSQYYCLGLPVCCDTERKIETCSDLGGEVCGSSQKCAGGEFHEASDLEGGDLCCIGGTCEDPVQESDCERLGGVCRANGCNDDEDESLEACNFGDTCCIDKIDSDDGKSYWFIWVLLFLIFLIVLGIIFRDKLVPVFNKIRARFDKGAKGKSVKGPRFPPSFPGRPSPRRVSPVQRSILPARGRQAPPVKSSSVNVKRSRAFSDSNAKKSQGKGEVDDVLKKLREMSK